MIGDRCDHGLILSVIPEFALRKRVLINISCLASKQFDFCLQFKYLFLFLPLANQLYVHPAEQEMCIHKQFSVMASLTHVSLCSSSVSHVKNNFSKLR
jgi:hypothetical protein